MYDQNFYWGAGGNSERCLKWACDQQIRELLSVYHTMTHQPHESVADFTHRFSETQHELDKLIPGIHKTAGKEIELIFAEKFRKNSFPENSNLTNCKTL